VFLKKAGSQTLLAFFFESIYGISKRSLIAKFISWG
jgi:hypothetical protein